MLMMSFRVNETDNFDWIMFLKLTSFQIERNIISNASNIRVEIANL